MKHLGEYILGQSGLSRSLYEGMFDIDKNITDTHELEKTMFEDPNSDFWKYCKLYIGDRPASSDKWNYIEKEIDIDKNKIYIPDNDLHININPPVDNPFVNKYSVYCNNFYIGETSGIAGARKPVTNGGGFAEIHCNKFQIDGMCGYIDGIKCILYHQNSAGYCGVVVHWASALKHFDAEFIFKDPSLGYFTLRGIDDFPDIKNVKSNVEKITLYDPSLFDTPATRTKMDKFFGSGTIVANGITKNKNIRNIVAIVNNIRKYNAIDPLQVIPEGKVSDLIDTRGFKNLEQIRLKNNRIHIVFVRPDNKDLIERHARFIRINDINRYRDMKIADIVNIILKCQTKDGWVVLFEPDIY